MPRKRSGRTHALPNKWGKSTPNRHRIEGNTAYIELTDRKDKTVAEALVSAEDLPRVLAAGRWNRNQRTKGLAYCGRSYRIEGRASMQWLHRFIMGEPAGGHPARRHRSTLPLLPRNRAGELRQTKGGHFSPPRKASKRR